MVTKKEMADREEWHPSPASPVHGGDERPLCRAARRKTDLYGSSCLGSLAPLIEGSSSTISNVHLQLSVICSLPPLDLTPGCYLPLLRLCSRVGGQLLRSKIIPCVITV